MRRIIGILLVLTFPPLAAAPAQDQAPALTQTQSVAISRNAAGANGVRQDALGAPRSDMVLPSNAFATGFSGPHGTFSGGAVLVVPSPALAAPALAELTEDLQIMSRVLDRLLDNANVKTRTWNPAPFGRAGGSTRSLFLPRFGALFLVEVAFPLAPNSKTQREKVDDEGQDALWREVRESLHGRTTGRRTSTEKPAPPYDEFKVENLTRTLLAAMKHSANIRHLRPEDRVLIVAVENCEGTNTRLGLPPEPTDLIVVQAVKKDVDALLKGDLDAAAFRARTTVVGYQQPPLAVRSPAGSY